MSKFTIFMTIYILTLAIAITGISTLIPSNQFNVGDCIKLKSPEVWETGYCKIIMVGKKKYLYQCIISEEYSSRESNSIKGVDANFKGISCLDVK